MMMMMMMMMMMDDDDDDDDDYHHYYYSRPRPKKWAFLRDPREARQLKPQQEDGCNEKGFCAIKRGPVAVTGPSVLIRGHRLGSPYGGPF